MYKQEYHRSQSISPSILLTTGLIYKQNVDQEWQASLRRDTKIAKG